MNIHSIKECIIISVDSECNSIHSTESSDGQIEFEGHAACGHLPKSTDSLFFIFHSRNINIVFTTAIETSVRCSIVFMHMRNRLWNRQRKLLLNPSLISLHYISIRHTPHSMLHTQCTCARNVLTKHSLVHICI